FQHHGGPLVEAHKSRGDELPPGAALGRWRLASPAPARPRPPAEATRERRRCVVIASEITLFAKSRGPLTKRISMAPDGPLKSHGSACVMSHGAARRVHITSVSDFARLIERLRPNEAITLGALRAGLADPVQVVSKRKLNGAPNVIARTAADIIYRKGQPALAL